MGPQSANAFTHPASATTRVIAGKATFLHMGHLLIVHSFVRCRDSTGSLVYLLPFGKGHGFGSGWNTFTDEVLGG